MSGTEFDDFLNKFVKLGEPIKPEKFLLDLMVGEDQTSNVKQDFKDKFLIPFFNKIELFNKELDKNIKESNEISNEFKLLKEEIKKSKPQSPQDVKSSPLVEPVIQPSKTNTPHILSEYIDDEKIAEKIANIINISSKNDTGIGQEQKTFGPKETVISFSRDAADLLYNITDKFLAKDKLKKQPEEIVNVTKPQSGIMGFIKDLITSLPVMLAAIGGATALAGMFWPEIKKFIGDKFGDKAAAIFDQFHGTVNAIGKFFTVGGLQLKFGNIFKNVGELLGKLGDDLIMSFKGLFTGLADEGAEGLVKGFGAAVKAGGLKGILKGAAGAILKGVSKVTLKAIPLIGAVISFADAYGRFKEGQILQGTIDIAAGLAGLVPGLGTPFSIGLSVLNAFIDFKEGEEKEQFKTQSVSVASMLLKGVGFFSKTLGKGILKKLPLIGTMLTLASAWEKFQQGDILSGTLDVASGLVSLIPGLGIPLSIGIDLLNSFISTPENKENGVQRTGFSITTIATKALGFFAKLGKPFFKRLPLIGSLLSFGSAWDRFKENNIVGGILDVVSGIVSLVPGIGTVASIGLDILNSFLDSKDTETGETKSVAVGNFFKGVWEKFKTTGMFKAFSNLADGLTKLVTGDLKDGIKDLSKLPYIGGMFSGIAEWLNEPTDQPIAEVKSDKHPLSNVSKKILENLPKEYSKEEEDKLHEEGKAIVGERKGIEQEISKFKEDPSVDGMQKYVEYETKRKELLEKQKNLNYQLKRYKELKEGKKLTTLEDYESESKPIPIQDGVSGEGNSAGLFKDALKYSSTSSQFNGLTFQSPNDQKINVSLDRQDQMVAMKQGGAIDNTFKDLKTALDMLSFNLTNLIKTTSQNQQQPRQQPVVINNNSTEKSFDDHIKFSSGRDEICNSRLEWIRGNAYSRII